MLKLVGVILVMVFVIACVVAAGMALASYFISKIINAIVLNVGKE